MNSSRVSIQKYNLKMLAETIAKQGKVSQKDAKLILSSLSLKDLRKLTTMLKTEHEKRTVRVTSAHTLSKKEIDDISDQFGGRTVESHIDPKIGGGISARVYDMIYDLSVKSKIERLATQMGEQL